MEILMIVFNIPFFYKNSMQMILKTNIRGYDISVSCEITIHGR